jgi:LysM repeat protein
MGLGFGLIEYLILQPDPLLTELRWDSVWLPILILLIFTGLLEEIIFRGMLQSTASQYLGRWGVPYAALVFAVLHFGYRSALNVLFVLAVALLFGSVVQRRGTLLGVSIAHGLTNVSLFLVYPFLFANPGIGVSPPAELLLPLVPTPTPFQVISPTPEATATLSMPSPTLNIPASNLLEKGDHDSTKISTLLPTFSLTKCGSPPGWVGYAVQAGDTLWGISLRTGEKVEVLRKANCLDNAALIYIGQRLSVPHILLDATPSPISTAAPPTQIPTLPPTQIPKPTSEPSSTPTEPIPSLTPRNTPTLAPTSLPSGEG